MEGRGSSGEAGGPCRKAGRSPRERGALAALGIEVGESFLCGPTWSRRPESPPRAAVDHRRRLLSMRAASGPRLPARHPAGDRGSARGEARFSWSIQRTASRPRPRSPPARRPSAVELLAPDLMLRARRLVLQQFSRSSRRSAARELLLVATMLRSRPREDRRDPCSARWGSRGGSSACPSRGLCRRGGARRRGARRRPRVLRRHPARAARLPDVSFFVATPGSVLGTIGFVLLVGTFGGSLAAAFAARMPIAKTLRAEAL
jgi:hypothetical protein